MPINKLGLVFILFTILSTQMFAQQRFKAGIVAGINAAQLNGDDSAGYNKVGLVGGLRGVTILTDKMELSFEILFSQQGSRTELTAGTVGNQNRINLNYAAIPVMFNYLDWEGDGYYRLHFYAGLSYGRLLGATVDDFAYEAVADEFNQNDISWLAGATYYINEHFGITGRLTRSINLLFNNNKVTTVNANSLLGHYLTFHGVYMF